MSSRTSLLLRCLCLALALAGVIGFRPPVAAHAYLLRSEPAANSTVAESPAEIRLWFTEPISPEFSGAQVLDLAGEPVAITIQTSTEENNLLIIQLPQLAEDVYSVLWRAHSTADGHVTQGLVVFGVGTQVDSAAAPSLTEATPPWPEVLLRWGNFLTLMALVGAVTVLYFVIDPTQYPADVAAHVPAIQRRIWRWLSWCAGLAFLIGWLWLGWQTRILLASLPQGTGWLTVMSQWLGSRLGWLWLARQLLLLVMLIGRSRFQTLTSPLPLAFLLVALTVTQSLASHAAAAAPNTGLALVADIFHILAGGIWVGGLLALLVGYFPLLRQREGSFKALLLAGWQPFGRVAVVGVVVVIATGLYSTGREVASLDALLTTLYGQSLLAKLLLVLLMGAVGLLNSLLLHPERRAALTRWLHRPVSNFPLRLRNFPKVASFELAVGLLVLLVAGLLTAAPTAHGPAFVPREEIPEALSGTSADIVVNLAIKPNRPGQNIIDLRVASSRRPAPAPIARVIVRLRYLDQDFGIASVDAEALEPGR
ncbi:MAG: copper resistance protein CopC/CopD, partial [Anaerolineales bacterium]|nr:copper resistance protein CopC/CopD [Anaerolineales bacterium]